MTSYTRKCFEVPGDCWLCEKYADKVLSLYMENNLEVLSLPCDLSCSLYNEWDRGGRTKLYKGIEETK